MDHATAYKLAEAEHNQRLAAFKASPQLDSLEDEIVIVRGMIETALNNKAGNSAPLVRDLIALLGTLVKTHRAQRVEEGQLLERAALAKFAAAVVEIVTCELSGLPGWEEIAERISDQLSRSLDALTNQPSAGNGVETNGRKSRFKS